MFAVLAAYLISFTPMLPSDSTCPADTLTPLPVECWPGDTVIVLPSALGFYYEFLHVDTAQRNPWTRSATTPEKWLAGKTAIIELNGEYYWELRIRLIEDSTELYVLESVFDNVHDLAFYRDLRYAQDHYVGRSFYIWNEGWYDNDTGICRVTPNAKVQVLSAEFGVYISAPIRLRFQDSTGHGCYCDVSVSGTNTDSADASHHSLQRHLLDKPRKNRGR